jgi:tetratricopeptide (TPR) repeat protein
LQLWRGRGSWGSGAFTQREKSLAEQSSFYLAVPIAVFFHELAHAVAIWLFGGGVEEFGYRVFWGFVRPTADSFFAPAQNWFIALAGTLGSLAFGLVLWLVLRRSSLPALSYFGLRAFRYQIFFSLIYYPVFTVLGFYGDWKFIYDFQATPLLSGLTLVAHLGSLAWFGLATRQGAFEMPTFLTIEERKQFEALQTEAAANPHDLKLQLQMVDAYRTHGEKNKAHKQLRAFLKANPKSAEGYLQSAALKAQNKRQVPKGARDDAARAISLGLSRPAANAYANQLIGQYDLGVGRLDQAINSFSQAIEMASSSGSPELKAQLRYNRAVAYRRKENYELARQDIQEAIALSRVGGQGAAMSHYEAELTTINNHAGQS